MGNRSSIEKIDEQIDMLSNNKFVDKPKTKKVRKIVKNPKKILEEDTKTDDLMSDLVGDDESTKVFINKVEEPKKKIMETITFGKVSINQKKVEDVYLPVFLVLLILFILLLIVVI